MSKRDSFLPLHLAKKVQWNCYQLVLLYTTDILKWIVNHCGFLVFRLLRRAVCTCKGTYDS